MIEERRRSRRRRRRKKKRKRKRKRKRNRCEDDRVKAWTRWMSLKRWQVVS